MGYVPYGRFAESEPCCLTVFWYRFGPKELIKMDAGAKVGWGLTRVYTIKKTHRSSKLCLP